METAELVQLPREFREAWLEALRSGRYKQGTTALVRGPIGGPITYCCLGVACHLLDISVPDMKYSEYPEQLAREGYRAVDVSVIPDALMNSDGYAGDLAELNDNGKTFEEIADYIERTSIGV